MGKLRFLLSLMVVLCLLVPVQGVLASEGDLTLYEYHNTGDATTFNVSGSNWSGQTFTTGNTTLHTVEEVRLKLSRAGEPGTLNVYIYKTDDSSDPTGGPVAEGSIDADTFSTTASWYTVTMDESETLMVDTLYALVVTAKTGDSSNTVKWSYNSTGGYGDGGRLSSTNGGVSWALTAANDMMFEVWGRPALRILGVKVFEKYKDSGDQLFVLTYQAFPGDDYVDQLSTHYFNVDLYLDTTLRGRTKLPTWGYKPGSIFLSSGYAIPWASSNVSVVLSGISGTIFDGVEYEYVLAGSDWVGTDLLALDDWVFTSAQAMGTWYDTSFIVEGHRGSWLLTDMGSTVFNTGIPSLITERDHLFSLTPDTSVPEDKEYTHGYQNTTEGGWGAQWDWAMSDIGELLGVEGGYIGGVTWMYFMVLGISVVGVGVGNPIVGLICAGLPLMFIGGELGTVPINYILLPVFVLAAWAITKWARLV